jgi:murein DD-endopeptidase MepM/ murein hydrolase activator NlpD
MPFAASAIITGTSVFGYHLPQLGFSTPWNVAEFGHVGNDACEVDRTGTQTTKCSNGAKTNNPYAVPETAYDWSMAKDTPILAVADGIVRASYGRSVPASCCRQEG